MSVRSIIDSFTQLSPMSLSLAAATDIARPDFRAPA